VEYKKIELILEYKKIELIRPPVGHAQPNIQLRLPEGGRNIKTLDKAPFFNYLNMTSVGLSIHKNIRSKKRFTKRFDSQKDSHFLLIYFTGIFG
jgi:hypothetical protein